MANLTQRLQRAPCSLQITSLLVGLVVCVLVAACVLSSHLVSKHLRERALVQAFALTGSINQQAVLPLLYASKQQAASVIKPFFAFPTVAQVAFWDVGAGQKLHQVGDVAWVLAPGIAQAGEQEGSATPTGPLAVDSAGSDQLLGLTGVTVNLAGQRPAVVLEAENSDYWQLKGQVYIVAELDSLASMAQLQPQIEVLGTSRVLISKRPIQATVSMVWLGHGVLGLILVALALIVARVLSRRVVRSLEDIHASLHKLCAGTLSAQLPAQGPQEMRQLREAFNKSVQFIEGREQQLLLACDQAKADGQMKAEFVANVSHQIRTPLNGILGTLSLIESAHLSEEEHGYLTMARQSGQSLLSLVNSVLDFSALSSGKIKLRVERLNLQNLVESVLALHANTEAGKGLEMVCVYDRKAPIEVVGDMARIHQALNNLVENAAKHTYNGSVQIRVKVAPPPGSFQNSLLPEQKLFQISVRDTGVGISATEMAHLFEPYTRRQNCPVQREFGGCGLGLAITKSLVDLMGGEIHVESLEGEGSQFSLLLPMTLATQSVEPHEILQHFDFIYCVSEPGLHKEALISVVEQWGLPYEWSFQMYDWERHIPRDCVPQRVLILINGIAQMQRYEEHLAIMRERFKPMVVRFYQPLAEDRVLTNLVDLHVAKPVRRALLEEEILRHIRLSEQEGHHFPRARVVETVPPRTSEPGQSMSNLHILVVEDNKINQQVARATLKKIGCNVTLAENGQIAVDLMRDRHFDLIFMDCQMPVMDGFTATEKIRALGGHAQNVPIVALSANTSGDDQARCRAVGMNDFIGKPFNQHQLRDALQRWISDSAA